MVPSYEDLTIWTHASITRYLKARDFGVPVIVHQQALEKEKLPPDHIQVLIYGPDFKNTGTRNERNATVCVNISVNTTYQPTDVYHHQRIKGKVAEALSADIPLLRTGFRNADNITMGFLGTLPTQSLKITPTSVTEPDASLVEQYYCLNLC